MVCGYTAFVEQTTPRLAVPKIRLFTAYLGPVMLSLRPPISDMLTLEGSSEGVVVRCIDAAANQVTEQNVNPRGLTVLPTMQLSVRDNRFYGLLCALLWSKFESTRVDRQWWLTLFDRELGLERVSFMIRARTEYPYAFRTTVNKPLLINMLRTVCAFLAPVDCLHHTMLFLTFQRDVFEEVNVAHMSVVPILCNVPRYDNAFFADTFLMIGNGETEFLPLCSLDILAHELGHSVVTGQNGLRYQGESGALNESMADVMGYAFECYMYNKLNGDTTTSNDIFGKADWDIGEGIYLGYGKKLRCLSNPLECQQPCVVRGQYWHNTNDARDHGGVHVNSGVPNYCFYLIATSLSPTYALKLWYKVLKVLPHTATLSVFGTLLLSVSKQEPGVVLAVKQTKLLSTTTLPFMASRGRKRTRHGASAQL